MTEWASTRVPLILTSAGCAVAVGLAALLDSVLAPDGGPALPALWWLVYALYFALLMAIHEYLPRPPWLSVNSLLVRLVALGVVLVMLFAEQGWMPLLFFLSAAVAAFFWSVRAVFVLIGVQTLLVVVAGLVGSWSGVDLVVGVIIFGISQGFGALVVFTARSEGEARAELAAAHAELRSTAALLEMATREAERVRIARELHDVTGHHLTALALELEVASHLTPPGPAEERVARARSIAKDLLATVRTTVGQMRAEPPALEPALRELAAGTPGLTVDLEIRGTSAPGVEQSVAILRCAQETITNSLRHASASTMSIVVEADGAEVRIVVSDDGDGVAEIRPGNGLTGMQERFRALGGTVEVASRPGAGFTVTGRLPLAGDGLTVEPEPRAT